MLSQYKNFKNYILNINVRIANKHYLLNDTYKHGRVAILNNIYIADKI